MQDRSLPFPPPNHKAVYLLCIIYKEIKKSDQPLLRAEAFQQTVWHSCRMVNFLKPQGTVPLGFNPLWRGLGLLPGA